MDLDKLGPIAGTRVKSCPIRVKMLEKGEKAADGTVAKEEGQIEAIVSVFDNVDSYGDVVVKGAFERTLAEWAELDAPIPVYYSHQMQDPDMNIGYSLDAHEVEAKDGRPAGLWTLSQLALDEPKAQQVHKLMQQGRLRQFSFSFSIAPDGGKFIPDEDQEDEDSFWGPAGHFELSDLDLFEYGPTPVGANPATELIGMKGVDVLARRALASVKAGRVLSSANESELRAAYEKIGAVLSKLDGSSDDEGKGRTPAGGGLKDRDVDADLEIELALLGSAHLL